MKNNERAKITDTYKNNERAKNKEHVKINVHVKITDVKNYRTRKLNNVRIRKNNTRAKNRQIQKFCIHKTSQVQNII